MADRSLRYVVSAVDKNAGKTIADVASKGSKAAGSIGQAFGKLGPLVGGEVGELASKLSEHLDSLGEHGGKGLASKLAVGGAAMVGVGASLSAMGAAEKQAQDQLEVAVTNSGHSIEEFNGKIEASVGHMEKYGFTAIQTKDSLTTLTNATHDPQKALNMMGEAADLAAARHMSLNSAADALAKTVGGSTRLFKQFGIQVKTNSDGTKDLTGANAKLAAMLHGQADAAANNFTGKLRALRAEVTDGVASFGEKYGPAITAAGAAMTLTAPLMKAASGAISSMTAKWRGAGLAAQEGAAATVGADEEIVAANEAAAASSTAAGEGAVAAKGGFLAAAGPVTALAVGMVAAGMGAKSLEGWLERGRVDIKNMASSFDDLRTAVLAGEGSFEKLGEQVVHAQLKSDGFANRASAAGVTLDQLTAGVTGSDAAFRKLAATWQKSGKPSEDTLAKLALMHIKYGETKDATDKLTTSEKTQTQALNPLAAKLGITNATLATAEAQAKKTAAANRANTLQMQVENNAAGLLQQGLDKLNGRTLNVEQANIAFRNSEQQVSDAIKQNGHSLSDNTQKGRDNRSAILSSIQAAQQHAQAIATQTGSTDRATGAYHRDIDALRAHMLSLGLDRGQVDALIRKYGQVPKLVATRIDLLDRASAGLVTIQRHLDSIQGKTVIINEATQVNGVTQVQGGAGKRYNASGTGYSAGGRTIVAERETEIIDLPRGSSVTPLSKIRGGSGGAPVIININLPHSALYSPQAARDLVTNLENYLRSGGGIKGLTY